MENTEILAELAMSIGQIVDKKVAEKKPTLADAYKMVLEAINNGSVENEGGSVTELMSAIRSTFTSKYDDFVSDNKAKDDSCNALKVVKDAIENGDLATDKVADLLEAIDNADKYDDEIGDLVRNEADNYDLVDKDTVDEEWIFDNVSDSTIRDVALRYVNDNL
jgi:hypothetical protein